MTSGNQIGTFIFNAEFELSGGLMQSTFFFIKVNGSIRDLDLTGEIICILRERVS